MSEPSTRARELVAAVTQAYFMDGRGKSQISNPAEVRDALLTYIAELESRTHVYIVVQSGVYFHDIHGPYWSAREAVRAADEMARNDRDSHHDYLVFPLRGAVYDSTYGGEQASEPLYSVNKDTAPEAGA